MSRARPHGRFRFTLRLCRCSSGSSGLVVRDSFRAPGSGGAAKRPPIPAAVGLHTVGARFDRPAPADGVRRNQRHV